MSKTITHAITAKSEVWDVRDELSPEELEAASSVGSTLEAERLGGREVDDQFQFRRGLHWQIGGMCAIAHQDETHRSSAAHHVDGSLAAGF